MNSVGYRAALRVFRFLLRRRKPGAGNLPAPGLVCFIGAALLLHNVPGKGPAPFLHAGELDQTSLVVGGFQQAEPGREIEALVHIQPGDQLPGDDIAAGVAGDDKAVEPLVVEPLLAERASL